jgi:hypothetical protein
MTVRRSPPEREGPESHHSVAAPPLLTQRAALILVAALVIGVFAGMLAYLAGTKPADAVLTGGAAWAAAITLLNALIA